MKETFFVNARIGLAIFFGVLSGPALAIRCVGVRDGLGLVTAALVGGSIAWITCDPLRLWHALYRAVQVVREEYLHWVQFFIGFCIMVGTLVLTLVTIDGRLTMAPPALLHPKLMVWLYTSAIFATYATCDYRNPDPSNEKIAPELVLRCSLQYGNPIALVYWSAILLFRLMGWVVRSIPSVLTLLGTGLGFIGRSTLGLPKDIYTIVRLTFRYYHGTDTRICFTDAALFVGGAYWYGVGITDLVLWAFAGAVFGIINYEVVSVRILKLAPSHFSKN